MNNEFNLMNIDMPRVTILLIAYNQETYIEEALIGVTSQDYHNLEIIVSDDASTDETYNMISSFADSYVGRHKLICNRNIKNLGISGNLNKAISLSSGELFFIAAGDDVSLPERVSVVVKKWMSLSKKPDLLASYLYDLDRNGIQHEIIGVDDLEPYISVDHWLTKHPKLIGAAQAWTRRLYDEFSGMPEGIVAEDMVMSFRAMAGGGAVTIKTPLVLYRRGGITYKKNHLSSSSVISAFTKKVKNTKIELLHMLEVAARYNGSPELMQYFVGLYKKECLIESVLMIEHSRLERFRRLLFAKDIRVSLRFRLFFYAVFPIALKPFFYLKGIIKRGI